MGKARQGTSVVACVRGRTADGREFLTADSQNPLCFRLGEGKVIEGLERVVAQMTVGEKRSVAVAPEQGFGPRRTELIASVDKAKFPPHVKPRVGRTLIVRAAGGRAMEATVTADEGSTVVVDANHPLAGQELRLDIELLSAQPATAVQA